MRPVVTVADIAAALNTTEQSVRNWVKAGLLTKPKMVPVGRGRPTMQWENLNALPKTITLRGKSVEIRNRVYVYLVGKDSENETSGKVGSGNTCDGNREVPDAGNCNAGAGVGPSDGRGSIAVSAAGTGVDTRPCFRLTIQPKEKHMNQAELIANIATITGYSKPVVEGVLKTVAGEIAAELVAGGEATLPGLGKLSVAEKAARKGRNPKTGEEIDIPAKRVPKFSAAKALKDAVA